MAKPIIPSLDVGMPVIINKKDLVLKIVQFFIFNPGRTSSFYENNLISLRKAVGQIGTNEYELKRRIEADLTMVFNKYFPNEGIVPDVTITKTDGVNLSIGLEISYPPDGYLVIQHGDIIVNADNTLTFNFSKKDNTL